jgi:mannan endo-1,4-beta-mannosidase
MFDRLYQCLSGHHLKDLGTYIKDLIFSPLRASLLVLQDQTNNYVMRLLTFVSCAILVSSVFTKETMVKVEGNQFVLDGQTYLIKGANYWQGMNLGAVESAGGNRTRLNEELDQLKAMGINNLRIMASSEGPDDQPYRMRPSLQPAPGKYNEDIFEGLDYFMNEIGKRNMTAVCKCI